MGNYFESETGDITGHEKYVYLALTSMIVSYVEIVNLG